MGKEIICKLCDDKGFVEVSLAPDDSYTRHCECNHPDARWDIDESEYFESLQEELI